MRRMWELLGLKISWLLMFGYGIAYLLPSPFDLVVMILLLLVTFLILGVLSWAAFRERSPSTLLYGGGAVLCATATVYLLTLA